MAKVRWATQRHPNGRPGRKQSLLNRLSRHHDESSTDASELDQNLDGRNPATDGGPDVREEYEHSRAPRRIYVNSPPVADDFDEDGSIKAHYARNKVRTAKYTPLSFVPRNLWYQFHNVANLYFLLLIILQIFSIFGATNAGLSAVPLIVIIVITAIKDGIEDWRRTVLDNELNNTKVQTLHNWHNVNVVEENVGIWRQIKKATSKLIRLLEARRKGLKGDPLDLSRIQSRPSGDWMRQSMDYQMQTFDHPTGRLSYEPSAGNPYDKDYAPIKQNFGTVIDSQKQIPGKAKFRTTYWKNVRVGDIVRLRNDEAIPADMVVLSTSENDGACFVETKNLDGETNLKIRHALRAGATIKTAMDCEAATFTIESEGPTPNLYSYSAIAKWTENDPLAPNSPAIERLEPISTETLLLRGCSLRNTKWVIGVVVFTGNETKIMQNAGVTPSKRSRISRELNWTVISNFFILFAMCLLCGLANGIYLNDKSSTFHVFEGGSQAGSSAKAGVVTFFTCLILLQNLVPISLYISIEIVKTAQAYFIYSDIDMYHEDLDYPCTPKSWNISDDLGQIEYVFSDKTGTLTQNVMEFKKCTVNGTPYGEAYTEAMAGMAKREGLDIEPIVKKAQDDILHDRQEMVRTLDESGYNPYMNVDDLTFVSSKFVRDLHGQSGIEQARACNDFMLALALCHSVLVERDPKNPTSLDYKAQSPDEAALVGTARDIGFAMPERTQGGVILEINRRRDEYVILEELEFNSQRKRMSMIYKMPDGKIVLFCKGADNVILQRLSRAVSPALRQETAKDLDVFAKEGLRTLCIAKKEISEADYKAWKLEHDHAASSLENREEKISISCDVIEQDLILLGGTAIEDRLQEGVPAAIALLAEAGIKLWVLTGDKVETAINIGFSCNLLSNSMKLIVLNISETEPEKTEIVITNYLREFGLTGSSEELLLSKKDHSPPSLNYAVIIDGDALKYVLAEEHRTKFLLLCKQCKTVLCCRVSPSQKAEVVKMVKDGLDVMTLSIGDGANDVAMIQQADVGVGIAGVEGRQAVMSSDYAIGQFRFLSKLLLVHGRWSYRRIAEMVACFFYKNIVWTFTLFWFQIYDQFDGQYNFDYTYILLYNLAFTSLPIIFLGAFDQDVSSKVSMNVPQLYMRGILRKDWSSTKFWSYMLDGLYASIICFFIPYLVWNNHDLATFVHEDGHPTNSLVEQGTFVAAPAIMVVNTFVLINTSHWDWLFMSIWALSILLFWAWTGLYSQWQGNAQFYKLGGHVFGSLSFWATFLLTVLVALLPRFCILVYRAFYCPLDVDIIREKVKGGCFADAVVPSDRSSDGSSNSTRVNHDDPFRDEDERFYAGSPTEVDASSIKCRSKTSNMTREPRTVVNHRSPEEVHLAQHRVA